MPSNNDNRATSSVNRLYSASVLVLVALVSACGGGGAGNTSADTSIPVSIGVFTDSPVAGLRYRTPTLSGTTNEAGQFEYRAGEMVTFALGDAVLGSVPGAAIVTPFDVAGAAVETDVKEIRAQLQEDGSPLAAAINIARLLQSLDADGDANNGIELTLETQTAFTNAKLDWALASGAFVNQPQLRQRLTELGYRMLRRDIAIAHLYQSGDHGLWVGDKRLSRIKSVVNEATEDASSLPEFTTQYRYDDRGSLLRRSQEYKSGTISDSVTTYAYDAVGYPIRTERVTLDEPVTGQITVRDYDVSGNLVASESTSYGLANFTSSARYEYDMRGQTTRYEFETDSEFGGNRIWVRRYDNEGRLHRFEVDENGDGTPDEITQFEYNDDGSSMRTITNGAGEFGFPFIGYPPDLGLGAEDSFDIASPLSGPGAGVFSLADFQDYTDWTTYFRRDSNGYLTALEIDNRQDGSIDMRTQFEYDQALRLVKWGQDKDGDGVDDHSITYFYDDIGRLVERRESRSFGFSVRQDFRQYQYDEDNRRIGIYVSSQLSLPELYRIAYEYDTLGNVYKTSVDYGDDGTVDLVSTTDWEVSYRTEGDTNAGF